MMRLSMETRELSNGDELDVFELPKEDKTSFEAYLDSAALDCETRLMRLTMRWHRWNGNRLKTLNVRFNPCKASLKKSMVRSCSSMSSENLSIQHWSNVLGASSIRHG